MPLLIGWLAFTSWFHWVPGDEAEFQRKLLLKLPLLLFPWLAAAQIWKGRHTLFCLLIICLPMAWIGGASVINYLWNYRFLNQMVLESKPLPIYSQVYHIEFSVMLAAASLFSLIYLTGHRRESHNWGYQLLLVATLSGILSLHILSTRTGLVLFWMGAAVAALSRVGGIRHGWRWMLVAALSGVGLLMTVPSTRNRIVNTWQDFQAVSSGGDLNQKSFGQRWEAWRASLYLLGKHPRGGVGMPRAESQVIQAHEWVGSKLDIFNRKQPHNQYLETAVQGGYPALILFLAFWVLLATYAIRHGNLPALALGAGFALALVFESLLERQSGIAAIVVLLSWALSIEKPEE
ncbi:MAG: O-antigen ligase family protein [Bacteroidetes bacterium]|nr:O-antigen ligase family protein [Bacteroidota bacterium]